MQLFEEASVMTQTIFSQKASLRISNQLAELCEYWLVIVKMLLLPKFHTPEDEHQPLFRNMSRFQAQATAVIGAFQVIKNLSDAARSEEYTSELQSLMRISYAVFCLKTKTIKLHT